MNRNPFGGNAFGSGMGGSYPTPFPQAGFGQFGNAGGFFNGGIPFQGGNMFPAGGNGFVLPPRSFSPGPMNGAFIPNNGAVLPPRSFSPGPMNGGFFPNNGAVLPPRSFSPGPMNGQIFPGNGLVLPPRSFSPGPMNGPFNSGFGVPIAPGNGFMNQPAMPFPSDLQQNAFVEPNQFGSGNYGRPRSRHGSRHRSGSRRRHRSRSSSSDENEYPSQVPPFAGPGGSYQNLQPFPNIAPLPPGVGPSGIPPRVPLW